MKRLTVFQFIACFIVHHAGISSGLYNLIKFRLSAILLDEINEGLCEKKHLQNEMLDN